MSTGILKDLVFKGLGVYLLLFKSKNKLKLCTEVKAVFIVKGSLFSNTMSKQRKTIEGNRKEDL